MARPVRAALREKIAAAEIGLTGADLAIAETGSLVLVSGHGRPRPGRGAAVHVITGPSRTADIELTLTRGVHGPKEVHAIFVDAPIRG